jgi:hypothetical protein
LGGIATPRCLGLAVVAGWPTVRKSNPHDLQTIWPFLTVSPQRGQSRPRGLVMNQMSERNTNPKNPMNAMSSTPMRRRGVRPRRQRPPAAPRRPPGGRVTFDVTPLGLGSGGRYSDPHEPVCAGCERPLDELEAPVWDAGAQWHRACLPPFLAEPRRAAPGQR